MKELVERLRRGKDVWWHNPLYDSLEDNIKTLPFGLEDMLEAKERWDRFAPLLRMLDPDIPGGRVDSPLVELRSFLPLLEDRFGVEIRGRVFAKLDCSLPIAGSIKARGGIYEVLKFVEDILIREDLISIQEDYSLILRDKRIKDLLGKYTVVVGSTGNLGLSVGIMARSLGLKAEVHMSREARQWKKSLLRKYGVEVIEHNSHYSHAVEQGRKRCQGNSYAYFVDDEHSRELFLGYSTVAFYLQEQLSFYNLSPAPSHPLCIYLPCGVGGAPGGISFGLAVIMGNSIMSYVAEPLGAPCVTLSLITGRDNISLSEYRIPFATEADGLAVPSPSSLVMPILRKVIAGAYTMGDEDMFWALYALKETEDIKIEPSAAASIKGVVLTEKHLCVPCDHIVWLTGGAFVPEEEFYSMWKKGKALSEKK